MSLSLSTGMRRAVTLASISALALSVAGCSKEPVEKVTPSATSVPASDGGGASGAAPGSDSTELTDAETYELVKPKVTPEQASEIYDRAKTPIENPYVPSASKQLRTPSRDDYKHTTEKSDQGAANTLAVYTDALFYAFSTGDARPALEVVDTSSCLNCAYYLERALDLAQEGKFASFPDITYSNYTWTDFDDGDLYIELPYERSSMWNYELGEKMEETTEAKGTLYAKLHWTGSNWVLVEFADSINK